MKKDACPLHKRFLVDPSSVVGAMLRKSTWTRSNVISRQTVNRQSVRVTYSHQGAITETLTRLTGESFRNPATIFGEKFTEKRIWPLAPGEWLDWLHQNCGGDWIITDCHAKERGDRVWFELEADATLFALTWSHLRAERQA